MEFTRCNSCESYNLKIEQHKDGLWLVCKNCGTKQQKIKSNTQLKEIYKNLMEMDDHAQLTFKHLSETKSGMMCKCANCNTVLYKSWLPVPYGLYDLANANYCPNCGKKFIGS